jgi:hypothetical protein
MLCALGVLAGVRKANCCATQVLASVFEKSLGWLCSVCAHGAVMCAMYASLADGLNSRGFVSTPSADDQLRHDVPDVY